MPSNPDQQRDPVEKSLGDQATGADVSRVDRDMSLGDQSTTGDGLSSLTDLGSGLGEAIDSDLRLIDLEANFQIEGELGQGGMGAVLLATDRQLKRKVAIKRIHGSMAQSKTALQRFVTEAQSIAALNHFNIVQVYEFGRDAEGPLLVLEYVGGGSLLDKLKDGKLEVEEAVDITCQLCDALAKAHGSGIIHRDIKPANILLTEDGKPKLTDFGLARQESVDHGQTQVGAVLGTIDFMPPEQRRDATAVDARSDLWSLAATFYQMVTGKSPKIINLKNTPEALQDVLGKALEEAPEERYQTAAEFGDALRHSVAHPVAVMTHGLQQGQCPSCNVINELNAKFCESCQTNLRERCLNCDAENGAWAAGCTQCGSSHEELSEAKRTEYEEQKKAVARLRTSCQFKEASEATKEMSEDLHWRLKEYQQWATKEKDLIEAERQKRMAERKAAAAEARLLIKSDQLEDAVRVIEQIPAAMRNQSLEKLEKQIEERNAELLARIKELVKNAEQQQQEIKARHTEGNYQAAISTAEALASYSEPELAEYVSWAKEQLQALQAEFSKWQRKRVSLLNQAQTFYESEEYTDAIELLDQLPSAMASDPGDGSPEAVEVARLLKQSKKKVSQEQKRDLLREKFQLAEQQGPILCGEHRHADAIELLEPLVDIDDPQLNDLAEKVRKQLSVIRKEYQDLLAAQENLHAAAREFVGQHKYQEAVRLLEQIPGPLRGFEVEHLLSDTKEKSEKVQVLQDEIRTAWKEKKFGGLLGKVSVFLELKPDDPSAIKLHRKLKLENLTERITAATTATAKLPLVEEYLQFNPEDERAKQLVDKLREQARLEPLRMEPLTDAMSALEAYVVHMEALVPEFPADRGNDKVMNRYEQIVRLARNRDLQQPAQLMEILALFTAKPKWVLSAWPGGADQARVERDRWNTFYEESVQPLKNRSLAGLQKHATKEYDQGSTVQCPVCAVDLKAKNLSKHYAKVHPEEQLSSVTTGKSKVTTKEAILDDPQNTTESEMSDTAGCAMVVGLIAMIWAVASSWPWWSPLLIVIMVSAVMTLADRFHQKRLGRGFTDVVGFFGWSLLSTLAWGIIWFLGWVWSWFMGGG